MALEPAQYDFKGVVGGSRYPIILNAKSNGSALNMAGYSNSVLEMKWPGGSLNLELDINAPLGRNTNFLTEAQSAAIPIGRRTSFSWHVNEPGSPSGPRVTWMIGYFVREK